MRFPIVLAAALTLCVSTHAQQTVFPAAEWQNTTPAAARWNLDRMKRVSDYLKTLPATGVMLIQHGAVVASGGEIDNRTHEQLRKRQAAELVRLVAAAATP